MVLLLPLETVLMRRFGLWYCSARELSLEARANLGLNKNDLWTPALYDECCRIFESNKGCYKLSPRALSLIFMASNLTATMTIPTSTSTNMTVNDLNVTTGVVEKEVMIAVVHTTEAEAQLVKKQKEEWQKILKPSLGKIKKSKRNKLPPPSAKRTTSKKVSKDINVTTKSIKMISSSKNTNQVKGESSTEGESDSNNDFPISIIEFSMTENKNNTCSIDTKKSKKSTKSTKKYSSSKTAKLSSSKKTKSTSTKDVKSTAVKTVTDTRERFTAASPITTTTKKWQDDLSSVRERTAVIKRMVCKIPKTHWSSPMYSH